MQEELDGAQTIWMDISSDDHQEEDDDEDDDDGEGEEDVEASDSFLEFAKKPGTPLPRQDTPPCTALCFHCPGKTHRPHCPVCSTDFALCVPLPSWPRQCLHVAPPLPLPSSRMRRTATMSFRRYHQQVEVLAGFYHAVRCSPC